MRIYRTSSMIECSMWEEKQKALLKITPAADGAGKGQPKAGEKRFDYDKTISISFSTVDMLTSAFKLENMARGIEGVEIKKYADMSKVAESKDNSQKQLKVASMTGGNIAFNLSHGTNKANIVLSPEETYAIAKWFEFQAQKLILTTVLKHDDSDNAE